MSKQYFITVDDDGTISYPPELTDFMNGRFFNENRINRLEIIDHSPCGTCDGKGIIVAENYKLSGTTCNVCAGRGMIGRSVIVGGPAYGKKANKKISLSLQDLDRTLKVFIEDRP